MRKAYFAAAVVLTLTLCFLFSLSAADEPLRLEAPDGVTELTVPYNGTATLRVKASGGAGGYRYEWMMAKPDSVNSWSSEPLVLNGEDSLTIGPVTEYRIYTAVVFDANDIDQELDFYVHVENGLTIESKNPQTSFQIAPGTDLELEVAASCTSGGLTYEWHNANGMELMPDSTDSPKYTWRNIQKSGRVACYAIDKYHNHVSVQFEAEIDTGLTVSPKGSLYRFVPRGGSLTLEVDASCEYGSIKRYNWAYRNGGALHVDNNHNANQYTYENIQKNMTCTCTVYDSYGNSDFVRYNVYVVDEVPGGSMSADLSLSPSAAETQEDVTLSWNVTGASQNADITVIWTVPGRRDQQLDHAAAQGTRRLNGSEEGTIYAYIYVQDPDSGTAIYREAAATITQACAISLSVTPEDPALGDPVTISWNISGAYSSARINVYVYEDQFRQYRLLELDGLDSLSSPSGSVTFIPTEGEQLRISGYVYDSAGRYHPTHLQPLSLRGSWTDPNPAAVQVQYDHTSLQAGETVTADYQIVGGSGSFEEILAEWVRVDPDESMVYVREVELFSPAGRVSCTPDWPGIYMLKFYFKDAGTGWYYQFIDEDVLEETNTVTVQGTSGRALGIELQNPFPAQIERTKESCSFWWDVVGGDRYSDKYTVIRVSTDDGIILEDDTYYGYSGYCYIETSALGPESRTVIVELTPQDDTGTGKKVTVVLPIVGEASSAVLFLPRGLLIIEEEAFLHTAASLIDVPDSVTEIGQNAFPKGVTLITGTGSFAAGWAAANGYTVIPRQ